MNEFFTELLGNLGYGAIVAVIGLLFVFIGLILIIAAIYAISGLLKKIEKAGEKRSKRKAEKAAAKEIEKAAEPVVEAVPAPQPASVEGIAQETEEVTDDNELIAVITAAIAAMDGGSKNFVIRSVRRVAGWKNAARAEQVYKY